MGKPQESFSVLSPAWCSWGEKQRVAIIRAIANDPPIILADEPTGNLDSFSGAVVMSVLSDVCYRDKRTVLIVSHDVRLKDSVARILYMEDGRITKEERNAEVKKPSFAFQSENVV